MVELPLASKPDLKAFSVCFVHLKRGPGGATMTTTKVLTLIAIVVPFGLTVIAAALLLRKLYALHREDQTRRALAASA